MAMTSSGESASMRRLLLMGATGAVVAIVAALRTSWELTIVAAWSASCVAFLVAVWPVIVRGDASDTERLATVEDDTRVAAGLLLLTASTASLVGVAFALHRASEADRGEQIVLTVTALATIVLSWLVVNTVFTLRYAHLFYTPPTGGIDFPGSGDRPDYRDFAYLAFTIGMTYQVSDTGLRAPKFRRTVLGHGLLSYLFGTGIVAATINIVAGFVR
jgi:uncharacterized membrane protein